MGYLTDYDISRNSEEVIEAINEISGYGDDGCGEYLGVKWYDWREHLVSVSLMFPEQFIIISGEGEEQGDVWRAFFKNGKSHEVRPEVSWPHFDETMF